MVQTSSLLASIRHSALKDPSLSNWWTSVADRADRPGSIGFRAAYAATARKLGEEGKRLFAPAAEIQPYARPHWTVLDVGRLLLLCGALERTTEGERADLMQRLFEGGEIGEQESLLRTLVALPAPGQYCATAIDACRTNAVRVFEAIACENPYPASHFPELNFNQMVIKAIFLEVSARRIEGLSERLTPELKRMAADYGSERRAAGRIVPDDVDFIIAS